jgi:hypothetical protein
MSSPLTTKPQKRAMKSKNSEKPGSILMLLIMFALPLVIIPQTIKSAGNSTSPDIIFSNLQDTVKQKYDRTFRTFFTDPEDGLEKKVELRYRAGALSEILVNGKAVPQSEFTKYDKIIKAAEADAEKIKKDLKAASEELEQAMQELAKVDFKAMHEEIARSMENFDQTYMEEVRKAIDQARSEIEKIDREKMRREIRASSEIAREEMEKARQEIERVRLEIIIPEIERQRSMTEEERERFRQEMERVREELRINMEEFRANFRSGEGFTVIGTLQPVPEVSTKKRQEMEKTLEDLEKSSKKKLPGTNSRY